MIAPPLSIRLEEVIAKRTGTIDPSKFPDETFELLSIPAFDARQPEVLVGGMIGSSKQIVRRGDVLLSKIVPHIRRAWVVEPKTGHRLVASGEWIVFRDQRFAPEFLRHLLVSDVFHRQFMQTVSGVGGSLLRARPSEVAKIEVPLLSLDEQKRIAIILDRADSLRRKRQDAIRLVDDLLRTTLLTCLEQPCDALVVEQLLSVKKNAIRTGPFGSQLLHAEFTQSGVPVLGIDNVVTNRFRWDERRYISADKYEQLSRYTVYPGDVMVTIMGTTGRVAVAPDDLPICISTKHLCTMTVDRTKILPEFLWACLLWDPAIRAQSSRESKGAIMDGLNMGIVKGLLIKVPSMDVQQRFVSVLRKVDALRSKYKVAVDDGASLNAALTSKLLAGSSQH